MALLIDAGYDGQLARAASKDSFIPLGDAATLVLLSEDGDRGGRARAGLTPTPGRTLPGRPIR